MGTAFRTRTLRPVILIGALTCLALLLTGCPGTGPRRPSVVYELTDTGVVVSVEELDGGGLRVAMARGESIDLLGNATDLYGEIVSPDELILIGTHESAIGYATTRGRDDGCFVLNEPAFDDGTHILFDFGLRLPKTPLFDPGTVDDGWFPSATEGFCINGAGEVVRYGY
jgi:hypothetical protein